MRLPPVTVAAGAGAAPSGDVPHGNAAPASVISGRRSNRKPPGGTMGLRDRLRKLAADFGREALAIYIALGDRRTPPVARLIGGASLLYAVWPFDLIPDFLPVVGHLDDLVIVPAGMRLAVAMIPAELMDEFRRSADAAAGDGAAPVRGVPRGWLLLGAALATWVTVGLVGADIIALIRFILARR